MPKVFDREPDMDDIDDFIGEMADTFYDNDDERQALLSIPSLYDRLEDVYVHVERRSRIAALQKDIENKVRHRPQPARVLPARTAQGHT